MQSNICIALLVTGLAAAGSSNAQGHGFGALGSKMGPVAFLWPADRPWSAEADNTAPCGSVQGVTNRTSFPISAGAVSLSIAAQANVDFSLSFSNDPKSNSDFTYQAVSHTIGKVEPGHQCYRLAPVPATVKAGDNATIQLQYRSKLKSENDGRDQTFYACADIQFVDASAFRANIPCFNVTSKDFVPPQGSLPDPPAAANAPAGGLSNGAIAGIAVGTILGSLAVVGLVAFLLFKRRGANNDAAANAEAGIPAAKVSPETASIGSVPRR